MRARLRVGPALSPASCRPAIRAAREREGYGFAVGSLLIAFGNIGDRYGRLKLLMTGAIFFGIGSMAAALAPTPELLIGARALMGIAGATLLRSVLAVLSELFTDPRRRAQAIGIFAATFAAGFAIGPVIGGALLERFWWGSVFLVNLPVIALFLCFAPVLLSEFRAGRPGRAAVLATTCIVTPAVVDRIGKRAALLVCHFSIATGLLLLLPTTVTGGVGWYVASTMIAGPGYGISSPSSPTPPSVRSHWSERDQQARSPRPATTALVALRWLPRPTGDDMLVDHRASAARRRG